MMHLELECPECHAMHADTWDGLRDHFAVVYCPCGACFSITLHRREDHKTEHYTSGREGVYER